MSCGDNWQLVSARSGLGKKGKRGAVKRLSGVCVLGARIAIARSGVRPSFVGRVLLYLLRARTRGVLCYLLDRICTVLGVCIHSCTGL